MDRMTYAEAKDWFWIRTWIWSVPAAVVTIVGLYLFADRQDTLKDLRVLFAACAGLFSVLVAVLMSYVSTQWPWMRSGAWFGVALTAPICAAVGVFLTFLAGGVLLAIVRESVPVGIAMEQIVNIDTIDAVYDVTNYAMYASGFWSLLFGTWFSLRRDRYFVDSI